MREIETAQILGLGIDISKKKADVCLKHSKVMERFAISNDEYGTGDLLQKLELHETGICDKRCCRINWQPLD